MNITIFNTHKGVIDLGPANVWINQIKCRFADAMPYTECKHCTGITAQTGVERKLINMYMYGFQAKYCLKLNAVN